MIKYISETNERLILIVRLYVRFYTWLNVAAGLKSSKKIVMIFQSDITRDPHGDLNLFELELDRVVGWHG